MYTGGIVFALFCVAICFADPSNDELLNSPKTCEKLKLSDGSNLSVKLLLDIYNSNKGYDETLEKQAIAFAQFMIEHDKSYKDIEEALERFEVFRENLNLIEILNADSEFPVHGVTQFSDRTAEEFENQISCFKSSGFTFFNSTCKKNTPIPNVKVPDQLDYTKQGLVTGIKNQLQCGSCYAFSAIANIEGQYAKKNKKLVAFSEQQIVDCFGNGCLGGLMSSAESLIVHEGGLEIESEYPYTGKEGKCKFDKKKSKVSLSGCETWKNNISEEDLKKVLVSRGPLSVAVNAISLLTYNGRVLNGQACSAYKGVNHGVLLVGYGVDSETQMPYWKLKNSWGPKFGEKGYWRMQFGVDCLNILSQNSEIVNAILA